MKRSLFERAGDFLAGRGFYVALLLCVAAIGISLYYLIRGLGESLAGEPAAGSAQVTLTPAPSPSAPAEPEAEASPSPSAPAGAVITPAPAPSAAPQTGSGVETPVPAPPQAPQTAPSSYTWPVEGEVLAPFSVEVLAYDETMGDWRTHGGIDIAAPLGETVGAAAAGLVTAVDQSDLMGTVIAVDHGGGVTALYANLDPQTLVEPGDLVEAGEPLGTVGDTALAESAMASHLHFELAVEGRAADPLDYLP